jgi:hypothetical protein
LKSRLGQAWRRLWGHNSEPPPEPAGEAGSEPLQALSRRVFVINIDPVMDKTSGMRLSRLMNWRDIDELIAGYTLDVAEFSGGLVDYRVAGRVNVDDFPLKADRFCYNPKSYLAVVNKQATAHPQDRVDYALLLAQHHLDQRVEAGEFDEVWIFGAPYFGFLESTMAGKGAFFVNGGPVPGSLCERKYVIMGFSYERGVGEMLEDLGHRAESTLARLFHSEVFLAWTYNRNRMPRIIGRSSLNLFERFLCFDQVAPGRANVGTVHYAPNSTRDYEWGRQSLVVSCADDWYEFPNMPYTPRMRTMTARDWGGGDIRLHHRWWLAHLPREAGSLGGIRNNWWHYIVDPNKVK